MRRIYLSKRAVEGDNRIIEQEVATYLVNKMTECVQNSGATPQAPTEELLEGYLCSCAQHTPPSFSAADGSIDDGALVHIFRWCTAALAYAAYQPCVEDKKPWTKLMMHLHKLSPHRLIPHPRLDLPRRPLLVLRVLPFQSHPLCAPHVLPPVRLSHAFPARILHLRVRLASAAREDPGSRGEAAPTGGEVGGCVGGAGLAVGQLFRKVRRNRIRALV
ncbi:hypothetical protein PMIN06_001691 [Paraphaeosphaeria minitans]